MTWQIIQYGFGVFSSLLCSVALVVVLWDSYRVIAVTRLKTRLGTSHYEMSASLHSEVIPTPETSGMENVFAGLKKGSPSTNTTPEPTSTTEYVTEIKHAVS
jgi:hypothetical protein